MRGGTRSGTILLVAKELPLFSKVSGMVEGETVCKAFRPHFFVQSVSVAADPPIGFPLSSTCFRKTSPRWR